MKPAWVQRAILPASVQFHTEAQLRLAHSGPTQGPPFDVEAAIVRVGFRTPAQARKNLSEVVLRVPAMVCNALVPLLEESANPDAALNLFERLSHAPNREVFRLMERHPFLVHYAVVVFANSQWLGETLIQNPDLFQSFVRERGLDRLRSREEFRESFARVRSRSLETDMSLLLARFKRREYVRIMLRDLLGVATLAETTAEISALSDILIEEAYVYCESSLQKRYGSAQHKDSAGRVVNTPFTILSMGKLGGNELNYSSDVDLLYVYGDGEDAGTSTISNREYFIRLAQEITDVLSRITREGQVFRIDLRLRPQGAEGEPAVCLSHALRYYAETAHDWELQALIKVRHSAGDQSLGREFIRSVQPNVYRKELNFAAIETAIDALGRMKSRRRASMGSRAGEAIDVKLDRGGIRDIEFLVQCLQRVFGGSEPWLRSGGTLFSLQKLHDKNHLSGKDFHELTSSYEFLRKIEHRLQLRAGQQTHRLPRSEDELVALQRSIVPGNDGVTATSIVETVRSRMQAVAEIYNRIIHHQQQQQSMGASAPDLQLLPPMVEGGREQSYNQILSRLSTDSPELYRIASSIELGGLTRRNLYRFLGAACTSSERYATVIRAPEAVERALTIFGTSDFLTDILIRHPEEIATLADISIKPSAPNQSLFGEAAFKAAERHDPIFSYAASTETGQAAGLLRKHYRHRVFSSGARDVMELRPVFDSLEETTAAADDAISAALQAAGSAGGFCVLALGRLGTREFDILSDADLLFVRDEAMDAYEAARIAERLLELLSAYTKEGSVFPVDARLRPHGAAGELVTTPSQLQCYFEAEAQAWEALTYTKMRFVAGDEAVAARTTRDLPQMLARYSGAAELVHEIREMRGRLEKSEPGALNLKVSPGALYDIDFILGFLGLKNTAALEPVNMRRRLQQLCAAGLLNEIQQRSLDEAGELLRTTEHVIRLVDGRARKSLPMAESARQNTERLVAGILRRELRNGLESALSVTMREVRDLYEILVR